MKFQYIFMGIAIALLLVISATSWTHVTPGNVGIQVNNLGSGVQAEPKPVGWYFTPPGVFINEYPVSTRSYTWTKDEHEGNPLNEEFTFQDKSGMQLTADVAVTYHADALKAPVLYQKYRIDMDALISGPVHNAVRNALINEAGLMDASDVIGPSKAALLSRVTKDVQAQFSPQGLDIEQLSWTSGVRPPAVVQAQITQQIANKNAALAEQANVATATAKANAAIATAKGKAEAMQIEAQAISTNPQILQLRTVEKWDGHFPQYMGGSAPLPFLQVK